MPQTRWQKIEEIFQSALDLLPAERLSFVSSRCASDAELQNEVEKLIADYESASSFIESPVWTNSDFLNSVAKREIASSLEENAIGKETIRHDPTIGRRIGNYEIVREIGRGGMGAVYLATRADGIFRQQVAVKLIKRGMDTDFILKRFRQERQILASLNHQFIARLLDGGTTDDDLPYFVMEFIEGKPLYRYCDQKKLNIAERLKLFRQICRAIDFAHKNRVIHRDIKPPNILVTNEGVPKLLDFGIAKALNAELGFDTIEQTATAMRLMTPEYASPEQVCGGEITPASDIYSLGVLLYELLTGHRPYQFQNRAPHEIARVICDKDPMRPSDGITREDGLLPTGASEATTLVDVYVLRGAANFEDLQRELSGELEKIILKALRKDPGERYKTAAEFADDITRYLEGKPVAAETRFPSIIQTQQSGVKSEKLLAVLPLKILNLSPNADTGEEFLSVGLADAMISRLSGIRRLAVRPTSAVLRYADAATNPLQAGKELTVDFVLDGRIKILGKRIRVSLQLLDVNNSTSIWASQFDEIFTDALELEDTISAKVIEAVLPQLTETEKQKVKKRGTDNPQAFEAYMRGRYYWSQFTPESFPKAFASFQKAVELDPNYALAHVGLADYYFALATFGTIPPLEAYPKARERAQYALEIDASLGEAYTVLAFVNHENFDFVAMEKNIRRSIELNPNYSLARIWLSNLYNFYGRYDDAVAEAERAAEINPGSSFEMLHVGWICYHARRFQRAFEAIKSVVEANPNFAHALSMYSRILRANGKVAESVEAARKAYELSRDTPWIAANLAVAYSITGESEKAREILSKLENLPPDIYVTPYCLALVYISLGERDRAFQLLEESFRTRDIWMIWLPTDPLLDVLRDDERFNKLLRQMNNPQAKRENKSSRKNPPNTDSEKSIAVLPLKLIGESISEDTGDNYLCIGLADALITRLSNVRRFVVRPTSSVIPYGKDEINAFAAGKELGVDFVVDGNIRRVGKRIRVTAQLLSVNEHSTRWAQSFDENFSDVLALEDSISEKVAKSLVPHLTGTEERQLKKRGTDNAEAFEAYLRGRHHWNTFSEEGFAKALIFYNQAISIAPDYALAYAGIADYYNLLGVYAIMPFKETSAAAKEAALKAVALDDSLAEAHAALGFAVLMQDFDWEETEKHLSRAVELNPNYVTGRIWYSSFLSVKGEWDEALTQVRRALELDPLTPFVPHTLNLTLYYSRRFDEAIAATEKFIEREPRYGLAQLFLSSVLWHVGRTQEALTFANRAVSLLNRTPYTLVWLASAYAANGEREKAQTILAEIEELSARRYTSPYLMAIVHANLNDAEKAFDLLEKAWEIRDGRLAWLGVEPQFDRLRSHPRFEKILRQTKNPIADKPTLKII